MKALVLGVSGMLGHQVLRVFRARFDTMGTVRASAQRLAANPSLEGARIIEHVDALRPDTIQAAIESCGPDVVINCIGLIKQLPDAQNESLAMALNATFPHTLASYGSRCGFRLIHVSTDCVFSGRRGRYTEDDPADAQDLYGRSKQMGEVTGPGCLTLRSSLIGPELERRVSLLSWFLSHEGGSVRGFTEAIFSGLTTAVFARELARLAEQFPGLRGVYHVAGDPISKYDLLVLIRDAFELDVGIAPDAEFRCNRSLDGTRYRRETGFVPPTWPEMVRQLADECRYEKGRLK